MPYLFEDEAVARANAAGGSEVVDIHARFEMWFTWGFINQLLPLAIFPIAYTLHGMNIYKNCFLASTGFLTVLLCCSILAWSLLGYIWRFSSKVSFAAGC